MQIRARRRFDGEALVLAGAVGTARGAVVHERGLDVKQRVG
jgi:hypothetical protein